MYFTFETVKSSVDEVIVAESTGDVTVGAPRLTQLLLAQRRERG